MVRLSFMLLSHASDFLEIPITLFLHLTIYPFPARAAPRAPTPSRPHSSKLPESQCLGPCLFFVRDQSSVIKKKKKSLECIRFPRFWNFNRNFRYPADLWRRHFGPKWGWVPFKATLIIPYGLSSLLIRTLPLNLVKREDDLVPVPDCGLWTY